MRILRTLTRIAPITLVGLTACYMEVRDNSPDEAAETRITHPDPMPMELRGRAQTCEEERSADGRWTWQCYEAEDYTWRTSCKSDACQEVKVFAHYMLADDLGDDRIVHVEAFDNPYFQGTPASQVSIAHFDASRGGSREAALFLAPGEYYLRAYMTSTDVSIVPYSLGDMTLVSDAPVGVYGALSGAEMVRVAPRRQERYPAPVHIYLDKLFKKEGSEPATNAHLRINLTVADGSSAPDGRAVVIRLFKNRDLGRAPAAEFKLASELLLVQGRLGRAEFASPSLPEGDYLVMVFVDDNANGYYDVGELADLFELNAQAAAVQIRKDRTETLAMTLSPEVVDINP